MASVIPCLTLAFLFLWPAIGTCGGASSRHETPHCFAVEILGRGVLMSAQYDYAWSDRWSFGLGASKLGFFGEDGTETPWVSTALPFWSSYYFSPESNAWLLTAGVTWLVYPETTSGLTTVLGGFRTGSVPVIGTLGAGYEVRSENGFVLRLIGSLFTARNLKPWMGVTLGYAF